MTLRINWTFPQRPEVLVQALQERERDLVGKISQKLSAEQEWNQSVQEYREKLREVGVEGWENAFPKSQRDNQGQFRSQQLDHVRALDEIRMYRVAIQEDAKREPNRLYKLDANDLKWFWPNG